MKLIKITLLVFLALIFMGAVKPEYGGDINIRLNEPASLSYNGATYSNQIFYSMIYENFFYLDRNNNTYTNIFRSVKYEAEGRVWKLRVRKNLAFSDGTPMNPQNLKDSLTQFLQKDLSSSKKVARFVKNIKISGDTILLNLLTGVKNLPILLSAPDLFINSGKDNVFAGQFIPFEWEKGRHIKLKPNPYYAGGRSYLNSVTVIFHSSFYPEIFLSEAGSFDGTKYREFKSGIYQNVYLCFPEGRIGRNVRTAIYTLLKRYLKTLKKSPLGALTSEKESPVTINIPVTSSRRMHSILRSLKSKVYFVASLEDFEEGVRGYIKRQRLKPITSIVRENNISDFVKNNSVDFLVLEKVFNMGTGVEEKIEKIVRELSFKNFNEGYHKLLAELNEIKTLKNSEILMDHVAGIIGKVVKDGVVIPIYQKKFALMVDKKLKGVITDNYGRPLLHRGGFKSTPKTL